MTFQELKIGEWFRCVFADGKLGPGIYVKTDGNGYRNTVQPYWVDESGRVRHVVRVVTPEDPKVFTGELERVEKQEPLDWRAQEPDATNKERHPPGARVCLTLVSSCEAPKAWLCFRHAVQKAMAGNRIDMNVILSLDDGNCPLCEEGLD